MTYNDKLKLKYKLARLIVFLLTIFSLFAFVFSKGFGLQIILTDYFEVNYYECAKCQENGWLTSSIEIILCIMVILLSHLMASVITAIVLTKLDKTDFKSNFLILFKDNLPDDWFKDSSS
jgi:hypothetical protein